MDEDYYIPSRAIAVPPRSPPRSPPSPPPYRISEADRRIQSEGQASFQHRDSRAHHHDSNAIMRRSVFVCNLPIGCHDEDVYLHFEKRGFRPRCIRVRKRADGLNEGHGHVEFGSSEEAADAVRQVNETMIFPRDRGLYPRSILVKVPRCIEREYQTHDRIPMQPALVSPRSADRVYQPHDRPPMLPAFASSPRDQRPDGQHAHVPSYCPESPRDLRNPKRGERPVPHWMSAAQSASDEQHAASGPALAPALAPAPTPASIIQSACNEQQKSALEQLQEMLQATQED